MKKIFTIIFALLLSASFLIITCAASIPINSTDTCSILLDGLKNDKDWKDATAFTLVPTVDFPAGRASGSLLYGSGILYAFAEVSEDMLVADYGDTFDGITLTFSGAVRGFVDIAYNGTVLNNSLDTSVVAAATHDTTASSYTIEAAINMKKLLTDSDKFSLDIAVDDITSVNGVTTVNRSFVNITTDFEYTVGTSAMASPQRPSPAGERENSGNGRIIVVGGATKPLTESKQEVQSNEATVSESAVTSSESNSTDASGTTSENEGSAEPTAPGTESKPLPVVSDAESGTISDWFLSDWYKPTVGILLIILGIFGTAFLLVESDSEKKTRQKKLAEKALRVKGDPRVSPKAAWQLQMNKKELEKSSGISKVTPKRKSSSSAFARAVARDIDYNRFRPQPEPEPYYEDDELLEPETHEYTPLPYSPYDHLPAYFAPYIAPNRIRAHIAARPYLPPMPLRLPVQPQLPMQPKTVVPQPIQAKTVQVVKTRPVAVPRPVRSTFYAEGAAALPPEQPLSRVLRVKTASGTTTFVSKASPRKKETKAQKKASVSRSGWEGGLKAFTQTQKLIAMHTTYDKETYGRFYADVPDFSPEKRNAEQYDFSGTCEIAAPPKASAVKRAAKKVKKPASDS